MGNNPTSIVSAETLASSNTSLPKSPKGFFRRFGSGRWEKKPKTKKKKKKRPSIGENDDGSSEDDCNRVGAGRSQDVSTEDRSSKTSAQQIGVYIPISKQRKPHSTESPRSTQDLSSSSNTPQEHPCMDKSMPPAQAHIDTESEHEGYHRNEELAKDAIKSIDENTVLQFEDDCCSMITPNETNATNEIRQAYEDDTLNSDVISTVASKIGSDWKKLGRRLLKNNADVEAIGIDASGYGVEEMANAVLIKWQKKKGNKASITVLAQNLRKIGRVDIADTIKPPSPNSEKPTVRKMISNASSTKLQDLDDTEAKAFVLKTVQTKLKDTYSYLELKGLPWMENLVLTLKDYYVDLAMKIDQRRRNTLKELKIDEIFVSTEFEKQPVRILIEGGPGSGKTTLAAKLAYDWAKGEKYISQFDLVLLLPLRLFVGNWHDTLAMATSVEGRDKKLFLKLVSEESHSMLFILDGYDEASSKTDEEILPLIEKELYTKSTIIVTSRPGRFTSNSDKASKREFLENSEVAPTFGHYLDKRVTVKGFNEEQQKMFIDKHMETFSEEQKANVSKKFAKMVDKEVLTCPLFLLMLIVLFTTDEEVESTETKTGLYKHVFNLVFKRYYVKTFPKMSHATVDCLDLFSYKRGDKPPHIELMSQFSAFALRALNKSSLIVSKKEMEETYKCDPKILELGFLTQYMSVKGFREYLLYEPVHKSLLEFAAAYGLYLSYEENQRFPCKEDIIEFRPNETSSLFFPFLVGLMGDNAGVLFNIIHSYAFEYSCKFEYLHQCLLETNLTDSILKPLTPFLPPEWNIISESTKQQTGESNFLTSPQHEAIVGWGVHQNKIYQINWDVLQDVCLPTNAVMNTLVLNMHGIRSMTDLKRAISPQYNLWATSQKKIHCKYMWCSFSNSVYETEMSMEGFFELLQFIDFQFISFDLSHLQLKANDEDSASQKHCYEPLKYIFNAVENGKLKRIHLHCISTDNLTRMHLVNELVKIDTIEVLELRVEGMTQAEIDSFTTYAADSIYLRTVVLSTDLSTAATSKLPFVINLAKLCDRGQKSWNWVELRAVRVKCSENVASSLLIQHLEITSCVLTPETKLMQHCEAQSFNCAASLLTDTWPKWPCQTSLTELNISVDVSLLYRGLSSLTGKLRNLQILALTMTSLERYEVTLPFEGWISNAISCLRLKGFEIWSFSKNTSLATALVAGLIKCLEDPSLASLKTMPSPTGKLHMQYLMVNDIEAESGQHAANYLQRLKGCLRNNTLKRLEMVYSTETRLSDYVQTNSLFSKYSIKQAFPRAEGFRVEHDLWGSREHDSIYSKGKHSISLKQKDRISVSFKEIHNSRRATVHQLYV